MTERGRGCLEVKPSSNPFFQTTSSDIGVDPNKEINWKIDGQVAPFNAKPYNVDGNFSFLYTRYNVILFLIYNKIIKTYFTLKEHQMI
jgi:hypothetical protein